MTDHHFREQLRCVFTAVTRKAGARPPPGITGRSPTCCWLGAEWSAQLIRHERGRRILPGPQPDDRPASPADSSPFHDLLHLFPLLHQMDLDVPPVATVGVQQQVLSYLDRWFKSLQGLMNDAAATASRPCGLGGRGSRGASVLTRGGHVLSLSACLRLAFSNLFPTRPSGGFLYRHGARLPGPPLNPPPWILSAAGFRAGTSERRSGPWADAGSAAPAHLSPPRRACSCTPP